MKQYLTKPSLKIGVIGIILAVAGCAQALDMVADSHFYQAVKSKDGVLQYYDVDTNRVFTYVPYMDTVKDRAEVMDAYEEAQEFARQAVIEWAKKSYTSADATRMSSDTLAKMDSWDARIRSGEINANNINKVLAEDKTDSAEDHLEKLKDWGQVRIDFKQQEDAYAKLRSSAYSITKSESLIDMAIPSAFFAFGAVKMPEKVIEFIKGIPKLGPYASGFLNGSATYTYTLRPWTITILDVGSPDPATGKFKETVIKRSWEWSQQVWLASDAKGKLEPWDKAFRFGTGTFFGPIDDLQTLSGVFLGGSADVFSRTNTNLGANVKAGVLIGLAPGSGAHIQNQYFMFGWQRSDKEVIGAAKYPVVARFNVGYVIPINAVGSFLYSTMHMLPTSMAALESMFGLQGLPTVGTTIPTTPGATIRPPGTVNATAQAPQSPKAESPAMPQVSGLPATNQVATPVATPVVAPAATPTEPKASSGVQIEIPPLLKSVNHPQNATPAPVAAHP